VHRASDEGGSDLCVKFSRDEGEVASEEDIAEGIIWEFVVFDKLKGFRG
jgi:hypothetical protein